MKKLFTNDKFFLITVILTLLIQITAAIDYIEGEFPFYIILHIVCAIALYVSYKKHSKNIMKGIMGSLLMLMTIESYNEIISAETKLDLGCSVLCFVLVLTLAVNHFSINSTHLAISELIKLNQLLCVLVAVVEAVWYIVSVVVNGSPDNVVLSVINVLTWPCICAIIVCVESRLDAYRLNRETAGWTEEKGYPDDYVHECDKK